MPSLKSLCTATVPCSNVPSPRKLQTNQLGDAVDPLPIDSNGLAQCGTVPVGEANSALRYCCFLPSIQRNVASPPAHRYTTAATTSVDSRPGSLSCNILTTSTTRHPATRHGHHHTRPCVLVFGNPAIRAISSMLHAGHAYCHDMLNPKCF